MMRIGILTLALTLTSGCALSAGDGEENPAETSSIQSAVTVLPIQGTWLYDESEPVSTTCANQVPHATFGPFRVDQVSSTSYLVFPFDGTSPFRCTMTDARFTCPDRAFAQFNVQGLNAQLTVRASATGLYSDNRHGVGKQDVAVSCTGSQCNQLGTMPCGYVNNFTVRAL